MKDTRLWLAQNYGPLLAFIVFALMFYTFIARHPVGLTVPVATTAANKAVLLALIGMAQTVPVLTGGLDLSVGFMVVMTNTVASVIVVGSPLQTALGVIGVLAVGMTAGFINGAIVVYGRLQPIITTLATGAVYFGIALFIRPIPGGTVNYDFADFMTFTVFETIPTTLVLLLIVVVFIWIPFRRSTLGRGCYAAGSAEGAAYLSGVNIDRSKLAAYTMSGLLCAIAGLVLTFITGSGEASGPQGATFTLASIAAVVIGGTSLYGGTGTAIGSIFGAFILRTIDDLLFVFDLPPLWQPLFQGVVLLTAVSLGAFAVIRIRNRLDLFQ